MKEKDQREEGKQEADGPCVKLAMPSSGLRCSFKKLLHNLKVTEKSYISTSYRMMLSIRTSPICWSAVGAACLKRDLTAVDFCSVSRGKHKSATSLHGSIKPVTKLIISGSELRSRRPLRKPFGQWTIFPVATLHQSCFFSQCCCQDAVGYFPRLQCSGRFCCTARQLSCLELWYEKDIYGIGLWDQEGSLKGDREVGVFYRLPSQEDRANKAFIKKLEEVPSSQALLLMLGLEPLWHLLDEHHAGCRQAYVIVPVTAECVLHLQGQQWKAEGC